MQKTIQSFCAMLANEVQEFRGDIFITYDEIKNLAKGEKAVVLTRESGCEFDKDEESIAYWKRNFKTIYLIQRDTRDNEVLGFTTTEYWEDIDPFLKGTSPDAAPCPAFAKHRIRWQQKYNILQKAKADAEKAEEWGRAELLSMHIASLEQKERIYYECSCCRKTECKAYPFGFIPEHA